MALGISDTVFNFSINYGVDKRNQVKLTDITELTFQKRKVMKMIKTKRWLRSWSFTSLKDQDLKNYYAKLMKKHLTLEFLESNWKKAI